MFFSSERTICQMVGPHRGAVRTHDAERVSGGMRGYQCGMRLVRAAGRARTLFTSLR